MSSRSVIRKWILKDKDGGHLSDYFIGYIDLERLLFVETTSDGNETGKFYNLRFLSSWEVVREAY